MTLRGVRTAWQLLTRVPWPGAVCPLPAAAGWLPAAGAAVGAAAGAVFLLLRPLGPLPAAAGAVGSEILLTGALHWDGLADCCDALVAGGGRERRLEVMRDPRLGSGGVLGLAVGVLLAVALVGALPASARAVADLAAAGALARWVVALAAAWLPAADPDRGMGRALARRVRWPALAGATAWAAAAAWVHPAALPAAAAAGALTAWWLARPLGGATGDVYGAAAVAAQLAALGAMVWR